MPRKDGRPRNLPEPMAQRRFVAIYRDGGSDRIRAYSLSNAYYLAERKRGETPASITEITDEGVFA